MNTKSRSEHFAVIDTETNFYDAVMSIGIVIAKNDFQPIDMRYYILSPEYKRGGMFSNQLGLAQLYMVSSRENVMTDLTEILRSHAVSDIFAYNARFDCKHLPELKGFRWHDIMELAAYKQFNSKIPPNSECCSTGRLKRGYGVEPILQMLSGNRCYSETHNALRDAQDELKIMELLAHPIEKYSVI